MRARAALVRPALLAGVLALVLTVVSVVSSSGPGASRAAAQGGRGEPTPQTDASVPAQSVTMIGATPNEPGAPGSNEVWGVGAPWGPETGGEVLVRYDVDGQTHEGTWSRGGPLLDDNGHTLTDFRLDESPLAGQMTPDGAGVLAGTVAASGSPSERAVVLVRKPGGAFEETKPVPSEGEHALLQEGEALFGGKRPPLVAPLDEGEGRGGALVAPVFEKAKGVENGVLHWDGKEWSRETIAVPEASVNEFRVLAIAAESPSNAWLLAQLSSAGPYPQGAVALFRRTRVPGEGVAWIWKPVELEGVGGGEEAEPLKVPLAGGGTAPFAVAGEGQPPSLFGQLLTVTEHGVWVGGERADNHSSTMLFVRASNKAEEGKAEETKIERSWCTPAAGASSCEHELPESLPREGRDFAFASSAQPVFGELVITGLSEGVSLRLEEGETFKRVLALGGGVDSKETPGAQHGAAFSSAEEGWLGDDSLPVHLTLEPAASKLAPWPLPFRHALTSIAPEPGAPIGALGSDALAVGDQGEVARYSPGAGWLPESLFGPGERVENPRLRAVAWPTPSRAYAVGDEGQMWLWRGETGLWERDPATPLNFRGNLVGVAFDPSNPARGYAVGSSAIGLGGVLLRYGKTWTEEQALPSQVQGAFFAGIAFAGSEAIVSYRKQLNPTTPNRFVGGLLINSGTGWEVDQEAAAAIGTGAPEAVAGLPDGGAAFATSGSEGTRVFERESAGAPWQPTATPVPRNGVGTLALFREGGALRAIATGGGASNISIVGAQAPPPGFPPEYIPPTTPGSNGVEDGLVRQTASGWTDESHEVNAVGEAGGEYEHWDMPYSQEPVLGVLINETGTEGWAIGGELNELDPRAATASIYRYPANGGPPLGVGSSTVPLGGEATLAIGGGAQCVAPCANRALAGLGPDVWLTTALQRAHQIGARAFLYTGPRVSNGETSTREPPSIPYAHELERYASLLASSPIPAYAAAAPSDLDGRPLGAGGEGPFLHAFSGFPEPFGEASSASGLSPAEVGVGVGERKSCEESAAAGCEGAFYAFNSEGDGGTVRVIVLDDSSDVDTTQLEWLEAELKAAAASETPAIVMGNADLASQVQQNDASAARVAAAIVHGNASAYFFYSPEQNVKKPLEAGDESIPSFGTGTLGYVSAISERQGDFHGASGILIAEIDVAAFHENKEARAQVNVRLIPVIGELALEAKEGILLRRSEPALFAALARRPRAGNRSAPSTREPEVDAYIPIPSNCVGVGCATALLPEYSFSSSNPDIGDFVEPNLAAVGGAQTVLQGANGKPIHDSQSGLFCAYNAGTTIVTISAGTLSSSLPVTVQPGSVREPCGTVPLKEVPLRPQQVSAPAPAPPPGPAPAGAAPASSPPPLLLPPPPPLIVPPAAQRHAPPRPNPPFFVVPPAVLPPLAFAPLPVPTPARPTPPTGTSAVTSPVEVAEHEDEEEEATESVSNQAVAYRAPEHEPSPAYLLGLIVLAAFAGASIRRRPRGGRRDLHVAPATLAGTRAQRRMSERRHRR